jgi:hypothetical protein
MSLSKGTGSHYFYLLKSFYYLTFCLLLLLLLLTTHSVNEKCVASNCRATSKNKMASMSEENVVSKCKEIYQNLPGSSEKTRE